MTLNVYNKISGFWLDIINKWVGKIAITTKIIPAKLNAAIKALGTYDDTSIGGMIAIRHAHKLRMI